MRYSKLHSFFRKAAVVLKPYDVAGVIDKMHSRNEAKALTSATSDATELAPPIVMNYPADMPKPKIGIVKDEMSFPYWEKFERFCKANEFDYGFIKMSCSDFVEQCKPFDLILWRVDCTHPHRTEVLDKIEFLEKYEGKMIMPCADSVWYYEDKVREQWLFEHYGLDAIRSFISYDEAEALAFAETATYPLVHKDRTCSGSNGVTLLKTPKQAQKLIRKIFSRGVPLSEYPYRQKNYVLFQEFVPSDGKDYRVFMIGDYFFGYTRFPKENDFRASGSGNIIRDAPPLEVLELARKAREKLPHCSALAIDFLKDSRDGKYYIIETTICQTGHTCADMIVDGTPGRLRWTGETYEFVPGRFWAGELMAEDAVKRWMEKQK